MAQTIADVVGQLKTSLSQYVEATYHIGDPRLVAQRRALLDTIEVIHQAPYIESTPRYKTERRYREISGIPRAALEAFELLSAQSRGKRLLHDPPYTHQAKAIEVSLIQQRSAVIMTGTGSGKTESFLLPILGKLANEARESPSSFGQTGMRALILYPMNALVNDQLGRLRSIFADPGLTDLFTHWAGRPLRFARYTSRTPYAGVRTAKKDQRKLKSFGDFFVQLARDARNGDARSVALISELKLRGKWPSKPDLEAWYGNEGAHWQDSQTHEFRRAVTLPTDSELVTRHEVQAGVPDLLVTNYSMLEYMMMRPIERSIFDRTRDWLRANPDEAFLLVLDEAHLYRGAPGAEVALLIRRLRDRLEVDESRFQVICSTASFEDRAYAVKFGAQLSGAPEEQFEAIVGDIDWRPGDAGGSQQDAQIFASIDMERFYSEDAATRIAAAAPVLNFLNVECQSSIEDALHRALSDYAPLHRLINKTMGHARPISELGRDVFPGVDESLADLAATNLASLASAARTAPDEPTLLPCRVHCFFRGLRGLWTCMDPQCTEVREEQRGLCGKIFSQPREACDCGARVLELFTCRYCGTAYARGYCDNLSDPRTVWSDPGTAWRTTDGQAEPLRPIDILLEEPIIPETAELADYDLEVGLINPSRPGVRTRKIYLPSSRLPEPSDDIDDDGTFVATKGVFQPCAVCGHSGMHGRSTVQDHETKGDQPFQVLVSRQIQIQPPAPVPASDFAPLRGRKVLAFADSRQVAARLAPNLQMYSSRDALRPLMVRGFKKLQLVAELAQTLSLEDLYCAVLLAAAELGVRLRPALGLGESGGTLVTVREAIAAGAMQSDHRLHLLCLEVGRAKAIEALLADIVITFQDRSLGLEALAIASIVERKDKTGDIGNLPNIAGVATTREDKIALARAWIRCWYRKRMAFAYMPARWFQGVDTKLRVSTATGKFKRINEILGTAAARKTFNRDWLPPLLGLFTDNVAPGKYRLRANHLSLEFDGRWVRCRQCKSVHRPIPMSNLCLDCGRDSVALLDPDQDEVFIARKGYYRQGIARALAHPPEAPSAIVAAEHTAQLNSAQSEDVFSKAEKNELLFQDVMLSGAGETLEPTAVDVLSCTTTMEVGIDIGQLSGVALRNMPPGRANYQQRAGRAGRRGSAIATVITFGGSDTHDEHFFATPQAMIRGPVVDPILSLGNIQIVRRHVRAFLLQRYHQERVQEFDASQRQDLFSVLGSASEFKLGGGILSRADFGAWLITNEDVLRGRVRGWLPHKLSQADRESMLKEFVSDCLNAIDQALSEISTPVGDDPSDGEDGEDTSPEVDEERPKTRTEDGKLLDWLLYKGVLPRYAFPTDVATFHVFDVNRSSKFRPVMEFAPSQGLPVALSQYAPGKQVWIAGKCYSSGAIYSPFSTGRKTSWENRQLHLECAQCGFAQTHQRNDGIEAGAVLDCKACGGTRSVGPVRLWLRPPGFAHPVDVPAVTSPDDMPETSYATRAKLTMATPPAGDEWSGVSSRIRVLAAKTFLLVSNTGPGRKGYAYCTRCGRIEASVTENPSVFGAHQKPFPDEDNPQCEGGRTSGHVVLGTDFITDVALFSLRVKQPARLRPTDSATQVVLRTLSEALTRAATEALQIEPGEVMAEFRPALTPDGVAGREAEVFLYDTLPGGAGFSQEAAAKGRELFERALKILKECPENCDSSCYRCLRTFRNKIDHALLDRHAGATLLDYLLFDALPSADRTRLNRSYGILYSALDRKNASGLAIQRNVEQVIGKGKVVSLPIVVTRADGRRIVVALGSAITYGVPADPELQEAAEQASLGLIVVSELFVRKNLPAAALSVWEDVQADGS